jgi:hypothetical protein
MLSRPRLLLQDDGNCETPIMEPSHVDSEVVMDGIRLPVIFTVVRALGCSVTQGAGGIVMASAWPTRRSQSFRGILAVCRVRVCMFEWFKDGRGRQMQQDGACGEGWRVLKRQSRSQPRPCPDAPTLDDDHACHSMGTAYPYTVLCLSYTALCPVEPLLLTSLFTRLPRSLYRQHVVYCVAIARSRVPNALLSIKTRHLPARRSRGAGSPLASIPFLLRTQHSRWLPPCPWQEYPLAS